MNVDYIKRKYTKRIKTSGGWTVRFKVGVQEFNIGTCEFDGRQSADWFRSQFATALAVLIHERSGVGY